MTRAKTGGRQKGTPNKATARREAEIAAAGITPLDYMMQILRDETAPVDDRKWAAAAAAPYVHPRLSVQQHTHNSEVSIADVLQRAEARLRPERIELLAETVSPIG